MDQLTHKTLVTSPYNLTYSYYLSPNFHEKVKQGIPVLQICHGYPDDAHMWAGAVPTFLKMPYPFVLPDLLGFAGSSKPTEAPKYNYKQQADSLAQILDNEGVPKTDAVIPIGHDWGSAVSQRFYLYHRKRCIGLSLISLAYQIPSAEPFDLETANRETSKRFGYPQWEYWNWFTAPDAPGLMHENLMRFYEVMHGNYPSPDPAEKGRDIWMREMFCTPNAMREYITQTGKWTGKTVELKPYAKDTSLQKQLTERWGRDKLDGPVCYYHSLNENTMLDDEKALCQPGPNGEDQRKITVPVLFIGETGDWVCRTDLMSDAKDAGLVDDVEEKVVEAGHWVLYEKPVEIAELIRDWLAKKFPVKG